MLGQKIYKPIITQEQCDNYASIAEWCNANNAHLEDKGDFYEVVENVPYVPTKEEQIAELKAQLASTDYVAIKIAEGVATKEEYADILAERAEARRKINELQEQLN